MKNLTLLFSAAVLGSMITIVCFKAFDLDTKVVRYETPVVQTNYEPTPIVAAPEISAPLNFTDAATTVMPTVVHIQSTKQVVSRGQQNDMFDPFRDLFGDEFFGPGQPNYQHSPELAQSSGSGVIIASDGLIVTNNHVIDGADEIEVIMSNKESYIASLIGTDPTTDLALLQIEATGLEAIKFANSDNVKIGEWVLAVGNPFNLTSTVTAGIVSAKGRNLNILKDRSAIESFIQTDAAVNPGNSGGALVNTNGDLIGINTAIATPTGSYAGYSFAVPVNIVKKVTDDLLVHGVVQRGFIGVQIRDLDSDLAAQLNTSIDKGVYVVETTENGAASEAGINSGDVITKIDGKEVHTTPALQEMIGRKRPGDVVNVQIFRNGQMLQKEIKLRNKSGNTDIVTKDNKSVSEILGIEFSDITKEEAQSNGLEGGVKIDAIYDGKINKYTDVRQGFIITKIDGKTIRSSQDIKSVLKNKKGGLMLEGVYPGSSAVYYYAFGV